MATLFISDLHLDADRPDGIGQFLNFMETEARSASALYILGDLFEAWIGDDDTNPGHAPIITALADLRRNNVPCYFMHGNRDFLIGRRFATATGCELLGDYEVLDLEGERILLTHGDLLCTDDKPYMELRAVVRDPGWQRDFLAKPTDERQRVANDLRVKSQAATAVKTEEIMDVNQNAVESAMRQHGVSTILHGHTHRPDVHRGSVVRWDSNGFELAALAT
jgi:UDP-2,3-diacylglucosamine hydrolase